MVFSFTHKNPSSKAALWELNKKAVKTIKVLVNKADGRARIK
ncbi:hypothetical protein bcere0020_58230 [Bacillus cereus Rock3-29]|nr:hypothetical protein bcere0020_58230 [Bacillus cereus Rock3-29]